MKVRAVYAALDEAFKGHKEKPELCGCLLSCIPGDAKLEQFSKRTGSTLWLPYQQDEQPFKRYWTFTLLQNGLRNRQNNLPFVARELISLGLRKTGWDPEGLWVYIDGGVNQRTTEFLVRQFPDICHVSVLAYEKFRNQERLPEERRVRDKNGIQKKFSSQYVFPTILAATHAFVESCKDPAHAFTLQELMDHQVGYVP